MCANHAHAHAHAIECDSEGPRDWYRLKVVAKLHFINSECPLNCGSQTVKLLFSSFIVMPRCLELSHHESTDLGEAAVMYM